MIYETACKLYILFESCYLDNKFSIKLNLIEAKLRKLLQFNDLNILRFLLETALEKNSRISEKSQLFNLAESEKRLVAHTFEKNLRFK